jgi:putative hydrolases of HD superfamily
MKSLYDFFQQCNKLKETYRFSQVDVLKDQESSADHSWRLAMMSFMIGEKLSLDINMLHAVKLALIHDIAEAETGDIDARLIYNGSVSKKQKSKDEEEAFLKMTSNLNKEQAGEIIALWKEYEEGETREAKYIRALDKMEGLMHYIANGKGIFDEPDLMGTYGNKIVGEVPKLKPIFQLIKDDLKRLCLENGKEWKKEYNIS